MKFTGLMAMLLLVAGMSACAFNFTPPEAWERGNLAKPEMAWDPDPLTAEYREHTYNSKEQAKGGASVGGGGCGCSN